MRSAGTLTILAVCGLLFFLAGCGLMTPHSVPVPSAPQGPSTGEVGQPLTYSTGDTSCSRGHPVEYSFDWGDGTDSSWSSSTSASKSWGSAGSYAVRVQARCSEDPSVVSDWSSPTPVTIAVSPYGGIGDTRDNGRIGITVRGVRTTAELPWGDGESLHASPGHMFLIVDVRGVALLDGERVVVCCFRAIQADGEEHIRSAAAMVALGDARLDSRAGMLAGDDSSGEIAFEVSTEQEHYLFEYKPPPEWGDAISFRFFP